MKRKAHPAFRLLFLAALIVSFCLFLPRSEASVSYSISLSQVRTQIHDGTVDKTYYGRLYMANGEAPFTASVTSGSLPPGLALHNQGDEFFDLSGTPTKAGTYSFSVTIKDKNGKSGSWSYTVRIADKYTHFNVTVKNGEAQNIYGHAATTFQAGEGVTLSWKGYASPGHCLKNWVYPASVDPDDSMFFYMPAENITVEAVFMEVVQGSSHYADITPMGGPYSFSPTEENTLQAAWEGGLIGRTVQYSSQTYPWYYEFTQNCYYDLDKDGHNDVQLIRVENSLGDVVRYGGPAADTNLADSFAFGLTDSIIASMDKPVYEAIEYFLGHKLKAVGFQYPGCDTDGVKAHYVCTGCGALFWDAKGKEAVGDPSEVVLAAVGHNMSYIEGKKAGCTTDGLVGHYRCSDCGNLYYDAAGKNKVADPKDLILAAAGHSLSHITGASPSCTENGVVEHYECSVCGQWFWDAEAKQLITDHDAAVLKASGHSFISVSAKDADCTAAGNKAYYICSLCSEWFMDETGLSKITDHESVKIPAKGHTLSHFSAVQQTCTEDGVVEHRECSVCGQWFWDAEAKQLITDHEAVVLKAPGHSMNPVSAIPAGCTVDGNEEYYICGHCGEWFRDAGGTQLIADHDSVVIKAFGHSLTHYAGIQPSCTENGVVEHYRCSLCDEFFWDSEAAQMLSDKNAVILEATGHAMTKTEGIEPGCLKDGLREHYVCANCKDWFWDEEGTELIADHTEVELPAPGHSMIPISGKEADCTEAGVIEHYECTECGEWFWDAEGLSPIADHADVIREALGHSWGEWKVIQEATAKEAGLAERICLHDVTHRETQEIPAIGGPEETTSAAEEKLSIKKQMISVPLNGKSYVSGESVNYQVIVQNDGEETLRDVVVRDEASGKEWVIRSLAPGEREVFSVEHVMTAADVESGSFIYEPAQETDPAAPETQPVPAETTRAAELPTEAPAPPQTQPASTEKEPEKPGKDSSGIPGWVLIPAIGLGALSAGLLVALIGKNKALAAAASAAGKAAAGAAEPAAAKSAETSETAENKEE